MENDDVLWGGDACISKIQLFPSWETEGIYDSLYFKCLVKVVNKNEIWLSEEGRDSCYLGHHENGTKSSIHIDIPFYKIINKYI